MKHCLFSCLHVLPSTGKKFFACLFFILAFAASLAAASPRAFAQAYWYVSDAGIAGDSTTRLLWVKPGTGSGASYSGDTANVWNLNSSGNVTATGPAYGPYTGWRVGGISVAPDGSSRLLWYNDTGSDEVITIWNVTASGVVTATGPVYGPYAGWRVKDFKVAPNGTARLLWVKPGTGSGTAYSGDMATIWNVNASGNATATGPVYGPYPGWMAENAAPAADGTSRVVWRNGTGSGDIISIWNVNANGMETAAGPAYGPYSGWHADGFRVATDGTSRLLWKTVPMWSSDQVSVWNVNASGTATATGPAYGPYSGWQVNDMDVAPDGSTRLVWGYYVSSSNADKITIWNLNLGGTVTTTGPTYGPYTNLQYNSFGVAPDGTSRVLWSDYSIGETDTIWNFNATGSVTVVGTAYGPYH